MASETTIRIQKSRFYEPHRNLPNSKGRNGREDRFARRFARAYATSFRQIHPRSTDNRLAIAREIPANGYGIADCVAKGDHFLSLAKPTVRAFEAKLHDWRRALLQANRYRFFAHVPIVVLPAEKCRRAVANLDTFRLLKVGFWSFHPGTDSIRAHFTPRPSRPRDIRQASRALALVARASKALPIL